MRSRALLLLCTTIVACKGAAFDRSPIFALRAGAADEKGKQEASVEDDYERAQKAILDAISNIEHKVEAALECEVTNLFRDLDDHHETKQEAKKQTKKAVKQGAQKVKTHVKEHKATAKKTADWPSYPLEIRNPYEWPHHKEPKMAKEKKKVDIDHRDIRILHAVEAAEQAVLQAIEEEVTSIFHGTEHHEKHPGHVKKTKEAYHLSLESAKKLADETKQDRRRWFAGDGSAAGIEDYDFLVNLKEN